MPLSSVLRCRRNSPPGQDPRNRQLRHPDRLRLWPDRLHRRPDRRYRPPDRLYLHPDRLHLRPDRLYRHPDRLHRHPDRLHRHPERLHRRPDRLHLCPNRLHQPLNRRELPDRWFPPMKNRFQPVPGGMRAACRPRFRISRHPLRRSVRRTEAHLPV